MDTSALNQTIDNVNQANNTNQWILFTFVVIIPLVIALVAIPLAVAQQHRLKCPRCGNWRRNKVIGVQTDSKTEDNRTIITTKQAVLCKKCKNEFGI